jgi:WD40 repeat protein
MVESHNQGISFRDNTVVTGDVVGGNKYDIKFYAFASLAADGQINWAQYRTESKITEPYKFLSYYDTTDADIFFGRETVSQSLTAKITAHKLVLINGKSGSGKTSLINAGIIPKLLQQGYFTMVFRDYGYPTDVIKTGLESLENVALELNDNDSLLKCLQKTAHQTQSPLVIFLDQFERFFVNLSPQRRTAFIEEFSECLTATNTPNIHFIISIRQDFYGNLGDFWEVCKEFYTESYPYNLKLLTTTEAIEAIEKPLQNFKVVYDPDFLEQHLVPHLLKGNEIESIERIEPVHLQIVCNRLFETVRDRYAADLKEGKTVIIKESLYQELGKVEGILGSYVTSILNNHYSSPEQDEVKSILKQLVTSQGTRTFKSVREIADTLNLPATKIDKVLQRLDQSRLIETIPQDHKYSITHEYLAKQINEWYTLDELELKRARELYERCLSNWKQYHTTIPRSQFKEMKRFKKRLKVDSEGEQLFRASSRRYYGRDILIAVGLATLVGATTVAFYGWRSSTLNQIKTSQQAAEAYLIAGNQQLEALVSALKAEQLLRTSLLKKAGILKPSSQLKNQVNSALSKAVYQTQERHRFPKHDNEVLTIEFSSDGKYIVTASVDQTAKIWNYDGLLIAELKHQDVVIDAKFSPDSKLVVTASQDGTARIWNLEGQLLVTLAEHQDSVMSAEFSRNGQYIITNSFDKAARLWNLKGELITTLTGKAKMSYDNKYLVTSSNDEIAEIWTIQREKIAEIKLEKGKILSAKFSPSGNYILTTSDDSIPRIWSFSGQLLSELKGHTASIQEVEFSPNGDYIVTASNDRTARIWTSQGKLIAQLQGHQDEVRVAKFSPDGKFIVTTSNDGTARIWNIYGQLLTILQGHEDWVRNAQFSPDGNTIGTVSSDRTIRLWSHSQQKAVLEHEGWVRSVHFSPDNQMIVTASDDGTARLWTIHGQLIKELKGHQNRVYSARFSPNGAYIITTSNDSTVRLWNNRGEFIKELKGHQKTVWKAEFSPDNRFIVTASRDRTARLWNIRGELIAKLEGHTDEVNKAIFNSKGTHIVTASDDGTARIWTGNGQFITELKGHQGSIRNAHFNLDGTHIVTASEDRTARIWNLEGQLITELKGHLNWVNTAQFSPSGKHILTTSQDSTARLWTIEGKLIKELKGHTSPIISAKYSPDGLYIITATRKGNAYLWTNEGQLLAELRGHEDRLSSTEFSPDGQYVATTSRDGTARVWKVTDLSTVDIFVEACKQIRNYLKYGSGVENSDRHLCDGVKYSAEP